MASPETDGPPPRDRHDLKREEPPLLSKVSHATMVYGVQGLLAPVQYFRSWKDYFYPPPGRPNILKNYEARPNLPARIFFPASYDQTSQQTLPILVTIHGGGFCFGQSRELDGWNRTFADKYSVLVVSLGYSKAPWAPFPAAIHDVEAVLLAVLGDESLPIDRSRRLDHGTLSRTAILGFSAGGNLALAVSQLKSIRTHPLAPAAAVSVYGCVDLSVLPHQKLINRPFKPIMGLPRGALMDLLMPFCPTFDWSYIPYGHDLRDPLLSPVFARREDLPPFIAFVAAELDMIAHEGWRMACRLSHEGVESQDGKRRLIPDRESKDVRERVCGNEFVNPQKGTLLGIGPGESNERFAFEDNWQGGGVKWILVPDVLHAFDHLVYRQGYAQGDQETIRDAEVKTDLYMDELAAWLRGRVWGLSDCTGELPRHRSSDHQA